MATLRPTLQETARLPWVNAAFFGLQSLLTCIGLAVGDAGDVRSQIDTLLTPAAYAFSIWNVIYLLCMILLITDISYAGLSLYDSAAKPNALRLCFAASCVVNGTWCIVLASGHVVGASVLVSLLWLTLLPLYVFASYERNVKTVLWHEYLCSELCIRLYFAWITVEAVVSWTMTMQINNSDSLPLSTYLTILAVLLVMALSGLSLGRDPIMALVVTWALVGVTSKDDSQLNSQVSQDFEKIQATATLGAGVLVAMVLVSCSYWVIEFNCKSKPLSPRPRRLSRLSQASTKDIDYGSIRFVAAA
ncbi:uncharacterized protein PITG_16352 [Phytophthora infestans T30-4]|uniref:Transmembrane protein n=2 Tax=Phytophthora infestans TaxID=4787 RepID=D0NU33_PHYIT|nr:uncharacterized protein PITG_16352 [Phytophthora infestans T30-4]EEY65157.1 conserved hypothetical protein [Phytophthora infestans T30-4]KAF4033597.1 hypothetical protein GN244_ATG14416 [Phytophthora infestans]KAF4140569.1 hypothetical protein GN958_ATG10288 [Phytophthora infestans]KAI9989197.1 hypothetical protein PInf_019336 [Phytophthora infestans]|eukprot:XP_002897414.1 conserved hypothetical protein [Phytophthora infestans T30-4]